MSGDDRPRRPDDVPEFPLLFERAKPSLAQRMLSPLRELFRSETDEAEGAEAPAADPSSADAASPDAGASEAAPGADAFGRDLDAALAAEPAQPEELPGGPVQRATIQLLPGRLEPLNPDVVRQEVRFLRGGVRESVVTLGWEEGEPPAHVTLDHPSIQPRHARMRFRDGEWTIESLSERDPVEVNGKPVPVEGWARSLRGGDHVRIGEAVFRFHQQ